MDDTASKGLVMAALGLGLLVALGGCTNSHGVGDGDASTDTADDVDGDGFTSDIDCDDYDFDVHPDADERCGIGCGRDDGDGIDNNCDGVIDEPEACVLYRCPPPEGPDSIDGDGDGWTDAEDCNDADPDIHPGADERCGIGCGISAGETEGDGVDNDCDGVIDEADACVVYHCHPMDPIDADSDGWPDFNDCDDGNASVHPEAPELCDDGLDNNCDGSVDEDACAVVDHAAG